MEIGGGSPSWRQHTTSLRVEPREEPLLSDNRPRGKDWGMLVKQPNGLGITNRNRVGPSRCDSSIHSHDGAVVRSDLEGSTQLVARQVHYYHERGVTSKPPNESLL